jgi:hypothetical protein
MTKLLAPNGKPSNLTPEQYKLVRTPEFKAWFGDWENNPENASKVVDSNGEPLPVYHGTFRDFNIFEWSKDGGFYFTEFSRIAEIYAKNVQEGKLTKEPNENPIILKCFLNFKNPLRERIYGIVGRNKRLINIAIKKEYDSLIISGGQDVGGHYDQYVAFNSNQIKLADGTNTTFDGNNPDIRYAKGGVVNALNFFKDTKCVFKPIEPNDLKQILDAYLSYRRKRNKPEFIKSEKYGNLSVDFESEKSNSFFQSRSLSYYFISEKKDFVIRISDHWSKSNYSRSKKLNCGYIRSVFWENYGEKLTYRLPSQSYSSELIGGICYFKDMKVDKNKNFKKGGDTKNKIMEKQMHIQFDETYAKGGVTFSQFMKDDYFQQKFNAWMEDGNVSKRADGTYSTQDAQYRNSLKGIGELKKYFYNEFIKGQYDSYAEGGSTDDKVLIAKAIEYITGSAIERDSIHFEANKIAFRYKGQKTFTDISQKLIEDTISIYKKSLEGRYADGGEVGFDDKGTDMIMYHEKKGNFIIPKGQIYLWLYDGENIGEKLQNEEYNWVFYPYASQNMAWASDFIPPLKRIWTKKFQKEHKGSEKLLGVIKAFLIEEKDKKELYIDMMSVNPKSKKKGIMSYMIKELRDTFKLEQDQVTFSDLTEEGQKFVAKKTYADGGEVESKINKFRKTKS